MLSSPRGVRVLSQAEGVLYDEAANAATDFAEAIVAFLDWHGYDYAEGLAEALARHPAYAKEADARVRKNR